jgi:hypothetical protein
MSQAMIDALVRSMETSVERNKAILGPAPLEVEMRKESAMFIDGERDVHEQDGYRS